ncbi:unnamed protein product [Orchesella dallaii]|uniref:Small ribosomal subunit protein mS25 n=1 Tax=Orchesella dallaii TaxID=48710 RepID=A0ABP1RG85_9HEXA
MTFMKGVHPIRRTLQHLNNKRLVLKPFIQIFQVQYKNGVPSHRGAADFAHWHLSQLQYKNPDVQVITYRGLTPTPFIRVFFSSGRELLMDVDRQTKDDIYNRVVTTLCKTEKELEEAQKKSEVAENPAHFGYGCKRHCICEIPGQIPCPAVIPLPYHMRGRYRFGFAEVDESKFL